MTKFLRIVYSLLIISPLHSVAQITHENRDSAGVLKVKHVADFVITGDGSAVSWKNSEWITLPQRSGTATGYQTQVKVLYSDLGIYCLYQCEDNKITATLKADFLDLWNEDVVEAFFWPDEAVPMY